MSVRLGDSVRYYMPSHRGPVEYVAFVAGLREGERLDLYVLDPQWQRTTWSCNIPHSLAGAPGTWRTHDEARTD